MNLTKLVYTTSLLIVGLGLAVNGYSQSFLTNGLVGYYPFNGNANDATGNGNNGVVNGTSISRTNNQFGLPNAALHFGGSSYISVTPTPFNVNSNWTISLWCTIDAGDNGANNFVSTGQDISGGLNIRWVGDQSWTWELGMGYDAGTGNSLECGCAPPNNAHSWNMLTCLRNGYSIQMFLNNALVASGTNTSVDLTLDTGALWFGNHQSWVTYYLEGSLSDIRIYNRALSPTEVQQLYVYESGPQVNLIKAVKPSFNNLTLTANYQLRVSADMSTWTNQGSPFTATNTSMVYPQYWDVDNWNSLYFRLQMVP